MSTHRLLLAATNRNFVNPKGLKDLLPQIRKLGDRDLMRAFRLVYDAGVQHGAHLSAACAKNIQKNAEHRLKTLWLKEK